MSDDYVNVPREQASTGTMESQGERAANRDTGTGGSTSRAAQSGDPAGQTVDDFRTGKLTRKEAIVAIAKCVAGNYEALGDYIGMLEEVESDRVRDKARGSAIVPEARDLDPEEHESSESEKDNNANALVVATNRGESRQVGKRARAPDSDSDDGDDILPKADPTKFAFFTSNDLDTVVDPVIRETLLLQRNYAGEGSTKVARAYLANCVDAPQFPASLWDSVLLNRYVDLDRVYSSLYTHGSNRTKIGRIGNVELVSGDVDQEPSKRVEKHGDWLIAWSAYMEARLFVYPIHRAMLTNYQSYVLSQFRSIVEDMHYRVIDFDKAVPQLEQACIPGVKTVMDHNPNGSETEATAAEESDAQTGQTGHQSASGGMKTSARLRACEALAVSATSVDYAISQTTKKPNAHWPGRNLVLDLRESKRWKVVKEPEATNSSTCEVRRDTKPRWARDFMWSTTPLAQAHISPSALHTEVAPPFPDPPPNELNNPVTLSTISSYPHLFKIVTPINSAELLKLLESHPNCPLVESLGRGFINGFWPFAKTDGRDIPEIVEYPNRPFAPEHEGFVRAQRDEEIRLGRFSESMGTELLPGMQTSPLGVVPKPHSDKLRLIIDQSAGEFALNSYIARSDASVKLDNLKPFGQSLLNFHSRHGRGPRRVFKTDVSQAYRHIPLHPHWQIKQAIKIDDEYYIDRCNCFGGRVSGTLWCIFFGLVIWVASNILGLTDIFHYVDDTFGFDDSPDLEWYEPYQDFYPPKQVQLLRLFDRIHLPHEKPKQVFGETLTIIGFLVDPQNLTITMPTNSRHQLVSFLQDFVNPQGRKCSLREWWRMLGYCNWALNTYPLLKPALHSSYTKIAGKTLASAGVFLNKDVIRDLCWFADRVEQSDSVHILEALDWTVDNADCILMCDSCLSGMGFWNVSGVTTNSPVVEHIGFFIPIPPSDSVTESTCHDFTKNAT